MNVQGEGQLADRAAQYTARAEQLTASLVTSEGGAQEPGLGELGRAYNLLSEALQLDEAGEAEDALEQYKLAVEVCLQTKRTVADKEVQEKLSKVAVQGLDRAGEAPMWTGRKSTHGLSSSESSSPENARDSAS